MSKANGINRSELLMVKMTKEEKEDLKIASQNMGMTMSGYCRWAIVNRVREDAKR